MAAKKKTPKLDFKINESVVYPSHGVGKIVSVDEEEIAGAKLELYVIVFEKEKMTLRVPTAKSKAVGMRKLSGTEIIEKALKTLKGRARVKRTMWSRRAQEYEAKINSGDLIAIAEVVRDLFTPTASPSSPIPSASSTNRRSTAWRAKSQPAKRPTKRVPSPRLRRSWRRAPARRRRKKRRSRLPKRLPPDIAPAGEASAQGTLKPKPGRPRPGFCFFRPSLASRTETVIPASRYRHSRAREKPGRQSHIVPCFPESRLLGNSKE